jgi:hypothetical protein
MIVATWKTGFYSRKADAQKVAEEIISLGEYATPEEILEKGRDETTELHKCFEWGETVAAEQFRLYQARNIVCNLVYAEPERKDEKPKVRIFYETERGRGYQQTVKILQNKDSYQRLLDTAKNELNAFVKKYAMLTELQPVFLEIEKLAD